MSCGCSTKTQKVSPTPKLQRVKTYSPVKKRYNAERKSAENSCDYKVTLGNEACETCSVTACIPFYSVQTKPEARNYCNAFVDVWQDDALYWINGDGFPTLAFQRERYEDNHEPKEGKFVSRTVIDEAAKVIYKYGKTGKVYKILMEEVEKDGD